jgi:hypothetical protein
MSCIYISGDVFDENIFSFAELPNNSGSRCTSEILLNPEPGNTSDLPLLNVSTDQSSLAVFPSFAAQHPQTILETASGAPHAVALGDAPAGPTTSTACAPERDNDTDPAGATAFPAYAPGRPDNGASSVSPAVNSEIRQAPLSPTPVNGIDPAPLINSGGNPAVPQSTPFSVEDSVPSYAVIRRPPSQLILRITPQETRRAHNTQFKALPHT